MTKADLVSSVAEHTNLTKKDVEACLQGILDYISETLKNNEEVRLIGFGTFSVRTRAATTARNPKTGGPVDVPETRLPVFKAGSTLKAAVTPKTPSK